MNTIAAYPGLKDLFDKCTEDAKQIIGKLAITVVYKIIHHDVSLDELLSIVCTVTGTTATELQSRHKYERIVVPRQAFCWFATCWFGFGMVEVGEKLNRDHTTVIHARDKVNDMVDIKDAQYMQIMEAIKEQILKTDKTVKYEQA